MRLEADAPDASVGPRTSDSTADVPDASGGTSDDERVGSGDRRAGCGPVRRPVRPPSHPIRPMRPAGQGAGRRARGAMVLNA